jgi:hypothetical protein
MENLQANIKEWEKKALVLSQQLAQFNRVKGKVDRQKTLYDRLTNNLKDVGVSQVVDTGDQVAIMENATAPVSVRPGLVMSLLVGLGFGAFAGFAILVLLDRIDDRMASFQRVSALLHGEHPRPDSEGEGAGQNHSPPAGRCPPCLCRVLSQRSHHPSFSCPTKGRAPRPSLSQAPCLTKASRPFLRTLPSRWPSPAPKPSSSMATCGAARSVRPSRSIPGSVFSEVLRCEMNWREVVVPTSFASLFVLPRGSTLSQPSEHPPAGIDRRLP